VLLRSLFWRVFALNAVVVIAASAVLVLSPAKVSTRITLGEIAILGVGLAATLAVGLVFTRRALRPVERMVEDVRELDPARPGRRVGVPEDAEDVAPLAQALNDALDRLERERRESSGRALAAQEAERLRIAQELHDEVGQSLTAILLLLSRVERRLPPGGASELAESQEAVREALADVRRIAVQLRPEALDDLGLPSALKVLGRRLADQSGLEIEIAVPADGPALSDDEELVLYRVAQEALVNVVRHAQATRAEVRLGCGEDGILLEVDDDGRGLDGAPPGTGLVGMRERAELIGAALAVGDRPGGGVRVSLALPREGA
jgi:two-component system sensor histidine kinase UhpB